MEESARKMRGRLHIVLRFGTIELAAALKEPELVRRVVRFAIAQHYPDELGAWLADKHART